MTQMGGVALGCALLWLAAGAFAAGVGRTLDPADVTTMLGRSMLDDGWFLVGRDLVQLGVLNCLAVLIGQFLAALSQLLRSAGSSGFGALQGRRGERTQPGSGRCCWPLPAPCPPAQGSSEESFSTT